jgi:hypothetical protein
MINGTYRNRAMAIFAALEGVVSRFSGQGVLCTVLAP